MAVYLGLENTARTIITKLGTTMSQLSHKYLCNKTTLDSMNTLVGNESDTASTSGSIFARLNYINNNIGNGGGTHTPPFMVEILSSPNSEIPAMNVSSTPAECFITVKTSDITNIAIDGVTLSKATGSASGSQMITIHSYVYDKLRFNSTHNAIAVLIQYYQ